MKYKIDNFIKNNIMYLGFILFGSLSLIFNIISILATSRAHIYDIIHAFPIILLHEFILEPLNMDYIIFEYFFIPIAALVDGIVGIVLSKVFITMASKEIDYIILLFSSFFIYWFLVTYQFIILH